MKVPKRCYSISALKISVHWKTYIRTLDFSVTKAIAVIEKMLPSEVAKRSAPPVDSLNIKSDGLPHYAQCLKDIYNKMEGVSNLPTALAPSDSKMAKVYVSLQYSKVSGVKYRGVSEGLLGCATLRVGQGAQMCGIGTERGHESLLSDAQIKSQAAL